MKINYFNMNKIKKMGGRLVLSTLISTSLFSSFTMETKAEKCNNKIFGMNISNDSDFPILDEDICFEENENEIKIKEKIIYLVPQSSENIYSKNK